MEKMNAPVDAETVDGDRVEEIIDQGIENLDANEEETPNEDPTENPDVKEPSNGPTGDLEGQENARSQNLRVTMTLMMKQCDNP